MNYRQLQLFAILIGVRCVRWIRQQYASAFNDKFSFFRFSVKYELIDRLINSTTVELDDKKLP